MSYVARVVWPDGIARFLFRGRLMDDPQRATRHPHPSSAKRAVDSYRAKHPRCIADVVDPNADGAPVE